MTDDLTPKQKRLPNKGSFPPGFCGNMHGRPKGSLSPGARLKKAGVRKVPITMNGRRRLRALEDIAADQVAANMAKGDLKSYELYLRETGKLGGDSAADQLQNNVSDLDLATKRLIAERLMREIEDQEAEERAKSEMSSGESSNEQP